MSQGIVNYATLVSFIHDLRQGCKGTPTLVEMTWEARLAIELANPRDLGDHLFYMVQVHGAHGALPMFMGLKVVAWDADVVRVLAESEAAEN